MKKELKNKIYSIFIRYAILILVALPNFWLFYFIFTPLTVYPSYLILKLFFEVNLHENTFFFLNSAYSIKIIDACIAGSAYYLLTILNLSLPYIKLIKRIKMIVLSFVFFLIANILRIVILSAMYVSKSPLFDIVHKISWYFLSIVIVVGIWFFEVKKFRIKEIPFYSDLKFLSKQIKYRNKT
jgi:exosortase/archaeosortase family protein